MATLLLRLYGPMQSWGTTSRFDERDTQLEPSKSGVLGLVCAALGRDRTEAVDDLARLRMGVRVDRDGVVMRDYQTATGAAVAATGKPAAARTVVSPRYYLADAVFLVGLEGEFDLLARIHTALRRPRWPLFLGRKSFVPSMPPFLESGLLNDRLEGALSRWPCLVGSELGTPRRGLLEDENEGAVRLDQPVAPFAERRFGPRHIRTCTFYIEGPNAAQPSTA